MAPPTSTPAMERNVLGRPAVLTSSLILFPPLKPTPQIIIQASAASQTVPGLLLIDIRICGNICHIQHLPASCRNRCNKPEKFQRIYCILRAGQPECSWLLVFIYMYFDISKQFRSILNLVNQYRRPVQLQKQFRFRLCNYFSPGRPLPLCAFSFIIKRSCQLFIQQHNPPDNARMHIKKELQN